MSKSENLKKELIREIHAIERRLSTVTILFHQAIAEKAGISGADHKYLDLIVRHGSMTAGKMAELSGLTTGAVTGVIDRLEKEGLVKRERDKEDRRKVVVILQKEKAMKQIGQYFQSTATSLEKLYETFSPGELLTIKKYLELTGQFFEEQLKELRK